MPEPSRRLRLFLRCLAALLLGILLLAGAAMALLDGQSRKALDEIQNQCKYIELSGDSRFNRAFPQHMMFCEEDELEWN